VTHLGYELVGCELQRQGQRAVLRMYIDKEKGVTLDDCSKVSHQISAILDVEDPIEEKYILEVSSPGLDRPLFDIAHYQQQIGKKIKLRLKTPVEGRRNFEGALLRVEDRNIHLLVDTEEVVLPFANIEKANVIADIRY